MTRNRRSNQSLGPVSPGLFVSVLALSVVSCSADAGAPTSRDMPPDGETATVLTMVEGHARPVLSFKTDGNESLEFYLDTGAGGNVLSAPVAERLGLQPISTQQILNPTDGIVREASVVNVTHLEANGLALHHVAFLAVELPQLGDLDGVLSIRALSDRLVTFDFPQRRILIEEGSLSPTDDGVMSFDPSPVITVEGVIGGRTLAMHVDTGSPDGVTLPGDLAAGLQFLTEAEVVRERGPMVVKEARLHGTVRIGPLEAEDPVVQIVDLFSGFGNLGIGYLGDTVMTVDQENRLLRIVRVDEGPEAELTGIQDKR